MGMLVDTAQSETAFIPGGCSGADRLRACCWRDDLEPPWDQELARCGVEGASRRLLLIHDEPFLVEYRGEPERGADVVRQPRDCEERCSQLPDLC